MSRKTRGCSSDTGHEPVPRNATAQPANHQCGTQHEQRATRHRPGPTVAVQASQAQTRIQSPASASDNLHKALPAEDRPEHKAAQKPRGETGALEPKDLEARASWTRRGHLLRELRGRPVPLSPGHPTVETQPHCSPHSSPGQNATTNPPVSRVQTSREETSPINQHQPTSPQTALTLPGISWGPAGGPQQWAPSPRGGKASTPLGPRE